MIYIYNEKYSSLFVKGTYYLVMDRVLETCVSVFGRAMGLRQVERGFYSFFAKGTVKF